MKFIFTLAALLTFGFIQAGQVDQTTAQTVATSFLKNQTTSAKFQGSINLTLAYTVGSGSIGTNVPADATPYAYVFNINTDQGFVIISAFDNVAPILGYSDEKAFSSNKLGREATMWLGYYRKQIQYAVDHHIIASAALQSQWTNLINGTNAPHHASRGNRAVTPLCTAQWNQAPFFNDACPYDSSGQGISVTGCPATAMSQILYKWRYPLQGTGIATYQSRLCGSQTANLGATTYDWAAMKDTLLGPNAAIALLNVQCGIAVHMDYSATGSGAYVITSDDSFACQRAYVENFGYDPATIRGLYKNNFTDSAWQSLLEADMDLGRPIQYAGFGAGGGHTWVLDGYDANNLMHMNWGWGGYANAYYALSLLEPGDAGIGSGSGDFNSNQEACLGIHPLVTGPTLPKDLQLNSAITVNPNPIGFTGAFTVNADVINNTAAPFSGDFAAMLFNASGDFITMIDSVSLGATPLAAGANIPGGLTFTNTGLLTVPGNYTIAIDYKGTGGNWYQVGSTNFTNPLSVAIANPTDDITLYSAITPSASTFVQGRSATVTVNLENQGAASYLGTYEAYLVDVHTGNTVQSLGSYVESTGLAAGAHYPTAITFSTPAITAAPGTYILAITEEVTGTTNLFYAGGGSFSNPVNIDVVAAPIQPDPFEHDDSVAQAHAFTVNLTNGTDSIVTTGSNIHNQDDIDYYKFDLPVGGAYTIDATLYDESFASGAQTFTLPALTSYSLDNGATWSSVYTGGPVPTVTMANGGTVYFSGGPYFPGQLGTYQLNFKIAQLHGVGIKDVNAGAAFVIFPNPTSNNITVRTDGKTYAMSLTDLTGREVLTTELTQTDSHIDLSSMSKGIYIVKLRNGTQVSSQKLIVE